MDTFFFFFFKHWLFLCSTLTRIAQNDFLPHNVYVYFLCRLTCTWIHESVAELICMCFFLRCFNILCYASGFYMLLFVVRCLWCARMRARVCVLFIGIVQRNWACLTWKSAIEIKSLLLLLTSQQQASVSQGRICSDNFTCCHTEIEVADQTFYLTQSQYTDTGPTSPSADPITPGAWQGSHWSANF